MTDVEHGEAINRGGLGADPNRGAHGGELFHAPLTEIFRSLEILPVNRGRFFAFGHMGEQRRFERWSAHNLENS